VSGVSVRAAAAGDGPALIRLIEGLAAYEKLTPPDGPAAGRIVAELERDRPRFGTLLAEADAEPVGYAVFFETFSTFSGLPKLYLEDIFVLPDARKTGAGLALFKEVVREADRRGCDAVEWEVLDWNRLAIDFYERIGGRHSKEWLPYRLDREGMTALLRRP
jgi:GNAT superfamily N-acetyltransferase